MSLPARFFSMFSPQLQQDLNEITVVAAVSGGADSIAMASLLLNLKLQSRTGHGRVIIAHANHQLRGLESDGDEQFVRDWMACRQTQYPPLEGVFGRLNIQADSDGLENACRIARYNWLESVCQKYGARYLLTAHNADDQVETVLYRIMRSTGLEGLTGIAPVRQLNETLSVVRPMLNFTRQEILSYLQEINQPYRTDSTNSESKFARNKIRNELLPLLEREYNPNVRKSIFKLTTLACQAQEEITRLAKQIIARSVQIKSPTEVIIQRKELQNQTVYMRCEVFRLLWTIENWGQQAMGSQQWQSLALMTLQPGSTRVFPGNIHVSVDSDFLLIRR